MLPTFFKNTAFTLLIVAGFTGGAFAAADTDASKSLTKAEVEKIVGDYIMGNPQQILNSVDNYQRKALTERQTAGLEQHRQKLINDVYSPETGNADGDVIVVEFYDYNCGYCKKVFPTVSELLEKDKKVRFIFKEFPILGPSSELASKWALAAHKQKKFYEFHKALMSNRVPIELPLLEKLAKDAGLNVDQAKKDADSPEILQQIENNRALAAGLGLGGTPAFVIGDELVPGMIFPEDMLKKVSAAREKKGKK